MFLWGPPKNGIKSEKNNAVSSDQGFTVTVVIFKRHATTHLSGVSHLLFCSLLI